MSKIILIGFMGCGKSTVAHELAKVKSVPLYEMDTEILKRSEYPDMATLFQAKGEICLREWEIRLAKEWSHLSEGVVSCGGGVVLNKIILDYLRQNGGAVFFLNASFEVLKQRVSLDPTPRPLFQKEDEAYALYTLRKPLYIAYSDHIIDVEGRSTSDSIQHIISLSKR